jgi:DNA-binding MarR family transcriptional regulator
MKRLSPPAAADPSSPLADQESRARDDDHQALRLWLRLLSCTNRIEAPLRSRLRDRFAGSLPRFDLMAQLHRHPQGLKMRELSERLMVTGGNVTGLTNRLVAEGLVERRDDAQDGRATSVRLTREGQRQFRAMASEHEGWVVELMAGLPPAQQALLFDLLGRLKQVLPAPQAPLRRRARPGPR